MSDATLMKNLKPQTDRKIRCDETNSLRSPQIYDMSESLELYSDLEESARAIKKPRFIHRACTTDSPIYYPFTRETGIFRVLYCISGQALLISERGDAKFISDDSVIILPADQEYDLLLGRGSQNWITAHWEPDSNFVPVTKFDKSRLFVLNSRSQSLINLTDFITSDVEVHIEEDNLMLSWLNLLVYESRNSKRSFNLTPKLEGELSNLVDLVSEIKKNPQLDWNLTEASRFAGYSPFHFSRVFRSNLGIGLPKFVECCRTELAIERLTGNHDPINAVAEECGFGSSQAMRSAIREFTGFLPIELRGQAGE